MPCTTLETACAADTCLKHGVRMDEHQYVGLEQ